VRRLPVTALLAAALLAVTSVVPACAIVGGTLDRGAHPYVGALLGRSGRTGCSGVLVSSRARGRVFLTAAHCLGWAGNRRAAAVTFGARVGGGRTFAGTSYVMPGYVPATHAHDVAVVVFHSAPRIRPVRLGDRATWLGPGATVTTVGYGIPNLGVRRSATEVVTGSGSSWLYLRRGSGNSCNGDSGGPDLISEHHANVVVALTDLGTCSSDQDYRVTGPAVYSFVNNR
jgi:secreted trypsin-like serine protease